MSNCLAQQTLSTDYDTSLVNAVVSSYSALLGDRGIRRPPPASTKDVWHLVEFPEYTEHIWNRHW
jgi:hypothetical protein